MIIIQQAHICEEKQENCLFQNLLRGNCATKKFYYKFKKNIIFDSHVQYIMYWKRIAQIRNKFWHFEKVVILAWFLQYFWNYSKMSKNRGAYRSRHAPHIFFLTKHFWENLTLQMFRKLFEVFPKIFLLSQKNYLHTFMYIFQSVWNFSVFLMLSEHNFFIFEKK